MTEATKVEVTQADRDAAIAIRNAWDVNCHTAYEIAARHRVRALTQAGAPLTAAQKAGPVLMEALKQIQRETTAVTPDLENLQICIGTVNSHAAKVIAAIAQAQEPSNER
jgi:hypothetical protein